MPETLDEFFAEKHSIINELYIATADHNYILARWCFHQHLNVDFFWLAVLSLPKTQSIDSRSAANQNMIAK
jgi:hypothetical protein